MWLLLLLWTHFVFVATALKYSDPSKPCTCNVQSKFTSDFVTKTVANCTRGTIAWHCPMKYLEMLFVPINLDQFKGNSVCIQKISKDIEIIHNVRGILTWLKRPKKGSEICSSPVLGNITMTFKGPDRLKYFVSVITYTIVQKQSKEEVDFRSILKKKQSITLKVVVKYKS